MVKLLSRIGFGFFLISHIAIASDSSVEKVLKPCAEKSSLLETCIFEQRLLVIPKGYRMDSSSLKLKVIGKLASYNDRMGIILKAKINGQTFSDQDYFRGYSEDELESILDWKTPIKLETSLTIPAIESCEDDVTVKLRVGGYIARNHNVSKKPPSFIKEIYQPFEFILQKIQCDIEGNLK